MNLETECHSNFYSHMSFHPRFGWLKKAVDAVSQDPDIFSKEDAPVRLGVGKVMVDSIKFWAQAFGLIHKVSSKTHSSFYPTQFGIAMFSEEGLDPYLEDISTLWILHHRALSPKSFLPVWWLAINEFKAIEFTDDELESFVISSVEGSSFKSPSAASIKKDVDCLLRMYSTKAGSKRSTWEDQLDSPFRQMGFINPSPGKSGAFRFKPLGTDSVPPVAIAYACLEYAARVQGNAKVISLSRLVMDSGSPGKVLRVTQDEIVSAITEIFGQKTQKVSIASAAGAFMLTFEGNPLEIAHNILIAHHAKRGVRKLKRRETALAGTNSFLPLSETSKSQGLLTFGGA
jgi:Protein of unknown function (DUF4007)